MSSSAIPSAISLHSTSQSQIALEKPKPTSLVGLIKKATVQTSPNASPTMHKKVSEGLLAKKITPKEATKTFFSQKMVSESVLNRGAGSKTSPYKTVSKAESDAILKQIRASEENKTKSLGKKFIRGISDGVLKLISKASSPKNESNKKTTEQAILEEKLKIEECKLNYEDYKILGSILKDKKTLRSLSTNILAQKVIDKILSPYNPIHCFFHNLFCSTSFQFDLNVLNIARQENPKKEEVVGEAVFAQIWGLTFGRMPFHPDLAELKQKILEQSAHGNEFIFAKFAFSSLLIPLLKKFNSEKKAKLEELIQCLENTLPKIRVMPKASNLYSDFL